MLSWLQGQAARVMPPLTRGLKRRLSEASTPATPARARHALHDFDEALSPSPPTKLRRPAQDKAQASKLDDALDAVELKMDDGNVPEGRGHADAGGLEEALEQILDSDDSDEESEDARFVPGPSKEQIRPDLCMARIWGNGLGRQCQKKPVCGGLCGVHQSQKSLAHGRVDGPVPEAKLREMEKAWGMLASSSPASNIVTRSAARKSAEIPLPPEPVLQPKREMLPAYSAAKVASTSKNDGRCHQNTASCLSSSVAPCSSPSNSRDGAGSDSRRASRGSACVDFSWMSEGEEEERTPKPFRRRITGGQRRLHNQVQLPEAPMLASRAEHSKVQVGDVVRASISLASHLQRGNATTMFGEVCQLFEDSQGRKLMLLKRMYGADELRARCAANGCAALASDALHDKELVETDECFELPLSALLGPGLRVLSQEAFADYLDDESIDLASLGQLGPYFCRRSVAASGLLWPVSWKADDRAARREEALRSFRGSEPASMQPERREIPAGIEGRREVLKRAAGALRPGANSGMLPGRELEQEQIMKFLRDTIRAGGRKEVLYISGMPGTGKTASVLEVVRRLQSAGTSRCQSFEFAHVNAMCLNTPGAVFAEICRKIPSVLAVKRRRSGAEGSFGEGQAQAALQRYFTSGSDSSRHVVVLLIDEVDALVTQAQSVLYRLFDWLSRPGARLAVVAIANTMDLPERLLPRVASRLGMLRVNFKPYQRSQLKTILEERLMAAGAMRAFTEDALVLCAARVAAGSGDARKALQVCRRAIETQLAATESGKDPGPVTVTQLGVAETDLLRTNPAAMAVPGLGLKARRVLLAMVLELRRETGAAVVQLQVLIRRYQGIMKLCRQRESGVEEDAALSMLQQQHIDDVHMVVRRLQASSILWCSSGGPPCRDTKGQDAGPTLALGESLDVDDVADALSSVPEDEIAKELLDFVPQPMPVRAIS
eukprot:TRINITY_DN76464_c0_g1_i1.p1 TRINITY_DN76464_c0_g1~~TRINITY_DN76464_c0_g1_i1.p1  ORF type:complete len:949 (+),score=181.62 TRINITY_DN76464_c0_g1_i1:32-2878(+)